MQDNTVAVKKWFRAAVIVCALTAGLALPAMAVDYPLRADYPDVKPIETEELVSIFDQAIIVDARNKAEYDVIHMTGATNILVGRMRESDLLKLRDKSDKRPLVFYCNGVTCAKSYKASRKATDWGFDNVRCYDPGIFTWGKAHPDKTAFFDKVLTAEDLDAAVIPKEKFQRAMLAPEEFLDRSKSGDYTLIDIRDPNERSETKFSLHGMKVMSFDTIIRLIESGSPAVPKTNLLIADNVGKQVRWLQYYLERAGITNYYFIKGGVRAWKEAGL